MYSANDIAKWFIEEGLKKGTPLTPMQVIKLGYIAQGVHLAVYDEPFFHNSVEAWKYGPVVKSIYQRVKDFGKYPILNLDAMQDVEGINPSDEDSIEVLSSVFNSFGSKSGLELSAWTHRKGSAWDKAYHERGGSEFLGYEIDLQLLKEEFLPLVKKHHQKRTPPCEPLNEK